MKIDIDIGVSEQDRADIAKGLSHLLADSYTLYLKTHFYHWNVTGPMFTTLHQMFELQYTELATAVDTIAERIRTIGHTAPGSYQAYSKLTNIDEDSEVPDAKSMIRNLMVGHEAVVKTAREIIPLAEQAKDEPTADLIIQRMHLHEKTAWMLRMLLE